jgi:hypothetical protein
MTTTPATPLTSVMHDGRCLGFLLHRGKQGVEAFTRENASRSVGKQPIDCDRRVA